ncbi:Uncharacterised protein [Wolbachia endosymbiont wPip_Mol of Culex molestus]|nr:Uncharacterised protein [Wolbachia endosymbiont wPip_Mol of Culex molestus]
MPKTGILDFTIISISEVTLSPISCGSPGPFESTIPSGFMLNIL